MKGRTLYFAEGGERAALLEEGGVVELFAASKERCALQDIYAGTLRRIMPDKRTAFVDIGEERLGFYPLSESNKHKCGDKILLQVDKAPVDEKGARLTDRVTLPGHYTVWCLQNMGGGLSKKILDARERERLSQIARAHLREGERVIFRTEAEGAEEASIAAELERLRALAEGIVRSLRYDAKRLLYRSDALSERLLRDIGGLEAVLTAEEALVEELRGICEALGMDGGMVRCDGTLAHSLDKSWDGLRKRRIWLKSGAYIVIDYTEALTVVDVNSGKREAGGNTALAVNREACAEIARQLRLRDLGGIIVVDFIGLENAEERQELADCFLEAVKEDRSPVRFHGISDLDLLQCTRKSRGNGLEIRKKIYANSI